MELLDPHSLFNTVNNVSEAFLFERGIEESESEQIAEFIVSRWEKPGAYFGTFAPTEADMESDFILLTGEKVASRVGKSHIAGEEASRILRKLNNIGISAGEALSGADAALFKAIEKNSVGEVFKTGMYCCKTCSIGLWINLSSGAFGEEGAKVFRAGVKSLRKYRENGKW